jgi:hypothetical protein
MARKLACLCYRLIKDGKQYVDKGTAHYEARYREQQIRFVVKKAQRLGFKWLWPTRLDSAVAVSGEAMKTHGVQAGLSDHSLAPGVVALGFSTVRHIS